MVNSSAEYRPATCPQTSPPELWLQIISYLEPESLVNMAVLCRMFNDLCGLALFIDRVPDFDGCTFTIDSTRLPALQRSLFLPPIHRLNFKFVDVKVIRDGQEVPKVDVILELKLLQDVVARAGTIHDLHIEFMEFGRTFAPDPPPYSPRQVPLKEDIVTAFEDLMSTMAMKTEGRVICSERGQLFCYQKTVEDNPSVTGDNTDAFVHSPTPSRGYFPKVQDATRLVTSDLRNMSAVSLRRISSVDFVPTGEEIPQQLQPCTIIVVQWPEYKRGGEIHLRESSSGFSAQDLGIILPQLHIPHLKHLCIETSTLEPAVLYEFLCRHKSVRRVAYKPPEQSVLPGIIGPSVPMTRLCYNCLSSNTANALLSLVESCEMLQLEPSVDQRKLEITGGMELIMNRLKDPTLEGKSLSDLTLHLKVLVPTTKARRTARVPFAPSCVFESLQICDKETEGMGGDLEKGEPMRPVCEWTQAALNMAGFVNCVRFVVVKAPIPEASRLWEWIKNLPLLAEVTFELQHRALNEPMFETDMEETELQAEVGRLYRLKWQTQEAKFQEDLNKFTEEIQGFAAEVRLGNRAFTAKVLEDRSWYV
ncbi:hypothetical protein C8R43DRAFT_954565 [Mycena crocata]|nr:hypothetical protein C8R43DRAFT_954565 [Mycena crocata]